MMGFTHAVVWEFRFYPPNHVEKGCIEGVNIFSLHYCEDSALESAEKLKDAGYQAWVEDI